MSVMDAWRAKQIEKLGEKIDVSKFNEDQLEELLDGDKLSLPIEMYANPCYSAAEMKVYRTMLETARMQQDYRDKHFAVTDYGPEELVPGFKSESNYEKYPDRICYVPENYDFEEGGFGYTAKDILSECGGDKDLADMVFGLCSWEHPSTVLDQLDDDDRQALIEKKEACIQSIQKDIAGIRKEMEEEQTKSQTLELPDQLVGYLQKSLRDIWKLKSVLDGNLPLPANTDMDMITRAFLNDRSSLVHYCEGAAFALPDNMRFDYDFESNFLTIKDQDKSAVAFITADSYLLAEKQQVAEINPAVREEAARNMMKKTGWDFETCLEELVNFTDEELLRGYWIVESEGSETIIDNAKHIERIDILEKFENDYEAAKQAEKDGIKIIHDIPGLEDWTYIDTPNNRALITKTLEAEKKHIPLDNIISEAASRTTAPKDRSEDTPQR